MRPLPPFLRTRRARRVGIVLAIVVALRIALPFALEAAVAWAGPRMAGVATSVVNVDLGLLRGRVVIDGLAVAGPGHAATAEGGIDPATALLRWDRLDLNLEWLDLLRGRLRLSDLSLAGPTARVELDAQGAPILPEPPPDPDAGPPAPEPEPEPAAKDGAGWPIAIDHLALSGLDVRVLDGQETPAIAAGLEALRLEDVRFDESGIGLGAIGFEAPSLSVRRDFVLAERAPAAAEGVAKPESEAAAAAEPAQEDAPPPGAAAEAEPAQAATYRMETLRIERAEFVVLTSAGPLHAAIALDAAGVTTEPGARFPVALGLEIEAGRLDLQGRMGASPPAFEGRLTWSELPLPPFTLLARPELAGWIASQRASGELEIDFLLEPEVDRGAGLTLHGRIASHDLLFRDPESDGLALGWKRFEVPIDEIVVPLGEGAATEPVRVALGAVELEAPHASYRQPTSALDRLFPPAPESEATPAEAGDEAEGPAPTVTIASFALTGGELGYRDDGLRPAYAGRVRDLAISLRDVRLPEATLGKLALSARLPVRSKLSLEGHHGAKRSELHLSLDRLALPPLNPYAIQAAGYRVDEGFASVETEAERAGQRWDVKNQLVLGDIGLSSTGSGKLDQLLGIPVDLAMALLRDLEGNIRLGIPMELDRGQLRVGIGSVLRDALRAAVAGAITSPLKMMGAAVSFGKGGGLSVEPLAMRPGSVAFADDEASSDLVALAELVESRPVLAVRLHGRANDEDREGLAERILIERIAAGIDLPEVDDAGFFARRRVRGALEARGRGEAGELGAEDAALLARYRDAVEVPPGRFAALARERADAVARRLTGELGLPPEHVRTADEAESEAPGVRIAFE
ncbi:MAG TPA: DUF748 domain-containing protein, partial [Myxococcota bacterium]|nr:DUF748 domain-containing protein [Myxococcota bacterium]